MCYRVALRWTLLAAAALWLAPRPGVAGQLTQEEIVKQLTALQPKLTALKAAGKVGETFAGLVEALPTAKLTDDETKTVTDINSLRRALYAIVAKRNNITPEKAGEIAGESNFKRAKPGEWLKQQDGKWVQKK